MDTRRRQGGEGIYKMGFHVMPAVANTDPVCGRRGAFDKRAGTGHHKGQPYGRETKLSFHRQDFLVSMSRSQIASFAG